MADSNVVAGLKQLVVSGPTLSRPIRLDCTESPKGRMQTEIREAIPGPTGVVGYKTMHQPSFIEAQVALRDSLPITKLMNAGATLEVTAVLANGWTQTITEAWLVEGPEQDMAEGTTTLRFESRNQGTETGVAA